MATAKITLYGLYKYMEDIHEPLFGLLSVPAEVDKNVLIKNILLRGGEFEVLYPDPYFMENMIEMWSKKWQHTMERWVKALSIDYEPLENYDRKEDWTDSNNRSNTTERNENAIASDNSNSTGSGSTTNTVSAYDATGYQAHDQDSSSSNGSNTANSATSAYGVTKDDASELNRRIGRAHGNIGVTTSQQMLEAELDISRWNIYEEITDLFLNEFVIYIY